LYSVFLDRIARTTYVDVPYYVTDRVAWSVGRSVTLLNPTETAEPIEMPFELNSLVGLGNHVLDYG